MLLKHINMLLICGTRKSLQRIDSSLLEETGTRTSKFNNNNNNKFYGGLSNVPRVGNKAS